MLGKLIKHEFKATSRKMVPVMVILFVMAIVNKVFVPMLEASTNRFLHSLHIIILIAFIVAFIALGVVAFLLLVNRFYKNVLGDEGYLTNTLPVTVDQIVWSKLIVSLVWCILVGIVAVGSIMINVMDMNDIQNFFINFNIEVIKKWAPLLTAGDIIGYVLEGTVFCVLLFFTGCLQIYASLTLGNMFKKRKLLFSAIIFAALSVLLMTMVIEFGLFVDSLSFDLFSNFENSINPYSQMHIIAIIIDLSTAISPAILYFVTTIGLKKNLNLE